MDYDWDLIVSSFAQQYSIRLHEEYDSISHLEFNQLLIGLNGDTALGNVVKIRSEKDPKRIKEMTNKEKDIRREWQLFRAKQNQKQQKIEIKKENINKIFSQIFGNKEVK